MNGAYDFILLKILHFFVILLTCFLNQLTQCFYYGAQNLIFPEIQLFFVILFKCFLNQLSQCFQNLKVDVQIIFIKLTEIFLNYFYAKVSNQSLLLLHLLFEFLIHRVVYFMYQLYSNLFFQLPIETKLSFAIQSTLLYRHFIYQLKLRA